MCQALIARGAHVDARNNDNNTALMMASVENHLEVVAALIVAGKTPTHYSGLKRYQISDT